MARLIGPKHHMCRRLGERVCSAEKCPITRRPTPPGVHGPKGYGRQTEFGTQLKEKQKVKYVYGVLERQFRRYYEEALRRPGNTAELFLQLLERRLDNVVFRLGMARSRAEARQMISHGWVTVNNKRVDIPSYSVKTDEVVAIKPAGHKSSRWQHIVKTRTSTDLPSWLGHMSEDRTGKVLGLPATTDFPQNLNMTLVVEFYSR